MFENNATNYNGYFKISQGGGSYVTARFFNPVTGDEFSKCVRDYDYDCSRDDDELYYMPINEEAVKAWKRKHMIISKGDSVMVVKGRKIPVGTVATVDYEKPYYDKYGRFVCTYLYFTDGRRTNIDNCMLIVNS